MAQTTQPIVVTKASGEQETFNPEKVLNSLRRSGANPELAKDVLKIVENELYSGITTHEIYQRVFAHLKGTGTHLAAKYNLKRAIMELGPTGYPFEKYLARLLDNQGYQTKVGQQVKGKCVWHEVDVIAQKDGQKYMIEAKFHNNVGIRTDTKVALYVYARFLDVSAGDGFDQGWLVTNTKLTRDARIYSDCVGLKYMSWNYPEGSSLRELVGKSDLYPITILSFLTQKEKTALLGEGIVTCQDLLRNMEMVPKNKQALIKDEAAKIILQVATPA